MAYRPAAPPDKGFFVEITDYSSGLSSPKNTGYSGYTGYIDEIIDDRTIAVLIDSTILGAPVWFALSDNFKSGDDIPVFFMSELPDLDKMGPAELRRRYEQKLALTGGWIRDRIGEATKH